MHRNFAGIGGLYRSRQVLFAAIFLFATAASAQVYVDGTLEPAGDGTSWATAYKSLQDAIDDPRSATEEILVARAFYDGNIVMASGRRIIGSVDIPPDRPDKGSPPIIIIVRPRFSTILGDGPTTPSRGIVFDGVSNTLLEGFHISDHVTTSTDSFAGNGAGAIFLNSDSTNIIRDSIISDNTGVDGGGIACFNSSPQIIECSIGGNRALDDGGGIYCTNGSSPTIRDASLEKNSAVGRGGGLYASVNSAPDYSQGAIYGNSADVGGGFYFRAGSGAILSELEIDANGANHAGAIGCAENSPVAMSNTRVFNNNSGLGSVVHADSSAIQFSFVSFARNEAQEWGILYLKDCEGAALTECDFYNNDIDVGSGGIFQQNGSLTADKCYFLNNDGDAADCIVNTGTGSLAMTNSVFHANLDNLDASILLTSQTTSLISSCTINFSDAGIKLDELASATIVNTIFSGLNLDAIAEASVTADATVTNCLFDDIGGAVFVDEGGLAEFSSAAALNQFVATASGNVDGEAAFIGESSQRIVETAFNAAPQPFGRLEIFLDNANLTTGSLAGLFLQPTTVTDLFFPITSNEGNSITIIDLDFNFSEIQVTDLRPTIDSAAVDRGTNANAPMIDLLGQARPIDVPALAGAGDLAFDIGAFELQSDLFSEAVFVAETFDGPDDAVSTGLSWDRPYTNIQDAIDDPRSATQDIIVARGAYPGNLVMASGRRIFGGYTVGDEPGDPTPIIRKGFPSDTTTIAGDGETTPSRGMLFDGTSNTHVQDLWVRNHVTTDTMSFSGNGAGILFANCDDSNVIENVRVYQNNGLDGGGIACITASPQIIDSSIDGNSARDDGGGIYCTASASPFILTSDIVKNGAEDLGGGLYASVNSNPFISEAYFYANQASMGGGAYFRQNSAGFITGSAFDANSASEGAAVYIAQNSPVQISEARVFGNSSSEGGIVYVENSPLQMSNTQVFNNEASQRGLFISDNSEGVVLTKTNFFDNSQYNGISSIYQRNGSLDMSRAHILNNGSSGVSGLLCTGDGDLTLTNSVFAGNLGQTEATILLTSQSTSLISSCMITESTAGIVLDESAGLSISNTIFSRMDGTGITENSVDSDAFVLNCLFDRTAGGAFTDEGGLATFQTASALNQFVAEATGNIDGEATVGYQSEAQRISASIDGVEEMPFGLRELSFSNLELTTDSLVGLMIQVIPSDRYYPIVANGSDSITIVADFFSDSSFQVFDLRPTIDSAAVDRGSNINAPVADLLGLPRPVDAPDVGVSGDMAFDIGPFELQSGGFSQAVYVAENVDLPEGSVATGLSWDRPYPTIQEAIDDTRSATYPIYVASGEYEEQIELASGRRLFGSLEVGDTEPNYQELDIKVSTLRLGVTTTIFKPRPRKGAADGPAHIVRAVGLSDVFMTHFRLALGDATAASGELSHGGGFYGENLAESVRIEALEIVDCRATNSGGGMYITGGAPQIQHCVMASNSASNGGSVALVGGTTASLDGSEIRDSSAETSGGGIYIAGASPSITDVIMSGNSAPLGGGVTFDNASAGLFGSSSVQGCSASAGAGLFIRNSAPIVEGTDILFCSATQLGGGILVDNASPAIRAGTIRSNTCEGDGGGMAMRNASAPIVSDMYFADNFTFTGNGGGMAVLGGSNPQILDCEFKSNSVNGSDPTGGGVFVRNSSILLVDSAFLLNSAQNGGALAFQNATGLADRNWFVQNNASQGGAIHFTDSSNSVANSAFHRNSAGEGGAIYFDQGSPSVVNCTFDRNESGGPWHVMAINNASPNLINNLFGEQNAPAIGFVSPLGDFAALEHNLFNSSESFVRLFSDDFITTESELNALANASGNIVGDARTFYDIEQSRLIGAAFDEFDSDYADKTLPNTDDGQPKTTVSSGAVSSTGFDDDLMLVPDELAGNILEIEGLGFRRIRSNSENSIEFWGSVFAVGNSYNILDMTPIPSSLAFDAATTTTLAPLDIHRAVRPVDFPFVTRPAPATTLDIGAVEVVRTDLSGLLVKFLLGQLEIPQDDELLDAFDYNEDGVIDAADLVTLLP